MGQVEALYAAMGEVWQHCAFTSAQMLEGVLKTEEVLRVITEAKSAVVPGEFNRTGRRWRRADAKGNGERNQPRGSARMPMRPNHVTQPRGDLRAPHGSRAREELVKPSA
jgi:hypothetical protein